MISKTVGWPILATILVFTMTSCGMHGQSDEGSRKSVDERFVLPDRPRTSPSGEFTARVEDGPFQNGVATWIVVITDITGHEVFRDDYAYSTRHGVGVTWVSSSDQLWILSSDVGEAVVERAEDGTWAKTSITPETLENVPNEIRKFMAN